jgi:nucleoid DNA-binding protein
MSDISKYISNFLSINESVIIPGFGKINRAYFPAQLDRVANKISSPFFKVSFDFTIQEDRSDKLLRYIIEIENLSFEAAAEILQNYKKDLLARIFNGEQVKIEGIGIFYAEEDSVFIISDKSSEIEWLDAFPIERKNNLVKTTEKPKSNKTKTSIIRLLIGLSILATLIISLLVFNKNKKADQKNDVGTDSPIIDKNESELIKDSLNTEVSDSIGTDNESEPEKDKKTYIIVVGTYSNLKIAKSTENQLKADGYKTQIKQLKSGQLRLGVRIEGQKQDFETALKKIRAKYDKKAFLLD